MLLRLAACRRPLDAWLREEATEGTSCSHSFPETEPHVYTQMHLRRPRDMDMGPAARVARAATRTAGVCDSHAAARRAKLRGARGTWSPQRIRPAACHGRRPRHRRRRFALSVRARCRCCPLAARAAALRPTARAAARRRGCRHAGRSAGATIRQRGLARGLLCVGSQAERQDGLAGDAAIHHRVRHPGRAQLTVRHVSQAADTRLLSRAPASAPCTLAHSATCTVAHAYSAVASAPHHAIAATPHADAAVCAADGHESCTDARELSANATAAGCDADLCTAAAP